MTVALEPHPEGTILPVRAHAGARKNEIRGVQNGMLKVSVTQAPERGKANKAIIALLAKHLGVKKSQLERSEEHTSELQSHSFTSYAVCCWKKKNNKTLPRIP